jgi:hypothetical protein
MSGVGKLYRVLREGIRQRSGDSWKRPSVGDLINVSDEMGAMLASAGYAALAGAPTLPTVSVATPAAEHVADPAAEEPPAQSEAPTEPGRCPEHPRYQGRGEPRKDCAACAQLHAESHEREATA